MTAWVSLPLVLSVALALLMPRIAGLLPPPAAVWSLTGAAAAVALTWLVSLAMIAWTGVARTAYLARLDHYSAAYWRHVDPVAVPFAVLAGAVVIGCVGLFARAVGHEVRTARDIRRLARGFDADSRVVFVDDGAAHAYAIGGRRPRIVMSSGLVRTLSPAERRAVLAHEDVHLRRRHHQHLRVLRLAASVNPLVRLFLPAGVLAVERWADEETAVRLGDRSLVARTLLRAALASSGSAPPRAALGHTHAGDVGRRVAALMAAPPRPRWTVLGMAALLVAGAVLSPVYAADHLDRLLAAGSRTTTTSDR
jgi:Zn-dependent protease with chaperone function